MTATKPYDFLLEDALEQIAFARRTSLDEHLDAAAGLILDAQATQERAHALLAIRELEKVAGSHARLAIGRLMAAAERM